MVVFRSVTVPLKAAVMNLLSIGGAYGVVVAVFQWGGLLGLDRTYVVASPSRSPVAWLRPVGASLARTGG